jgi:uroporphyrinogen decarboxylase
MSKIFIDACFRKPTPYTPVWMMRQAGRYLPEYMEVRAKAGNFLNLCHNPEMACEVTLQPIRRFDMDAAILFSDILVVPNEMGMKLEFIKGEGPKFDNPIRTKEQLDALDMSADEKLTYVYDTIKLLKEKLPEDKALIGFCGAPWTIATYMVEGQGTKTYNIVKKEIYSNPDFMHEMLAKVTEVTKKYLEKQIEAGVDAVQIFDSWASALEPSKYNEFGWKYMLEVGEYIKNKYPHIAVILFPKGIGTNLESIDGNFDVFGVDWSTPMSLAKEKLGDKYVLQGNMEPCRLYSQEATKVCLDKIYETMGNSGHIFNLGHGILPDVPIENAEFFFKYTREVSKR